MMRRKACLPVFFAGALLALASCATPASPTSTAVPTISPSAAPPQRVILPASWTPGPQPSLDASGAATVAPPTPRTAPRVDDSRPTLPPSWTPQPFATVTRPALSGQVATRIPPTMTAVVEPTSGFGALLGGRPEGGPPTPARDVRYPPACAAFAITDPTDAVLTPDSEAHLSWTAVEGAESYRVWVMNPSFRYSFDQETTETSIVIPEDAFIGTGMYAWEVMPVLEGDRMCPSRTGIFTLRRD